MEKEKQLTSVSLREVIEGRLWTPLSDSLIMGVIQMQRESAFCFTPGSCSE